jgi:hypothetical protein
MMRIKRIRRYKRAKYPKGRYRRRKRSVVGSAAQGSLSSLLIMALTEACEGTGVGVTGPPPIMPEMVTENEARQVINRVFLDNGVSLQQDFPLVFKWAQDSLAFSVDGFNPTLNVGYEYVNPEGESPSLSQDFRTALEAAGNADGPFIEAVGPTVKDLNYEAALENEVLNFIQKLKGLGII